jgi:hypothetical protein
VRSAVIGRAAAVIELLLQQALGIEEAGIGLDIFGLGPFSKVGGGAPTNVPDSRLEHTTHVGHILALHGVPERHVVGVEQRPAAFWGHQDRVSLDDLPVEAVGRDKAAERGASILLKPRPMAL